MKNKEELLKRLRNYYLFDEIKTAHTFKKNLNLAERYFKYKELKKENLSWWKISKILNINPRTVYHWKKQTPKLIKIANQIPKNKLPQNIKWLNLKMEGQWKLKNFIKVPVKINNYKDIKLVLNQLQSLENGFVEKWKQKYREIDKDQAFGYIIGLMISDADKDRGSILSSRIRIGLSKIYDWSKNIGEAMCYCLSIIGIEAKRVKDGKPYKKAPNGKYIWRSQLTPFVNWLRKSCLGLSLNETTTHTPVRMSWVFNSSKEIIKWILNGIYDGDGCAHIRGWQITNADQPNQEFVNKLLYILDIKAVSRGPKSIIETKKSLKLASQLPIFRFATGKIEDSKKLIRLMENSNSISKRKDYNEIMRKVIKLNKRGLAPKDIPFKIFEEYNIGIHPRRIYTILNRSDLFG